MIYRILLSLAGDWGRPLLDLYARNSAWINSLILAYGVWVWLSWRNLRAIRANLLEGIKPQISAQDATSEESAQRIQIPWDEAVSGSRFPFIAQEWAFFPRRISPTELQRLLTPEDLIAEAQRQLAGKSQDQ